MFLYVAVTKCFTNTSFTFRGLVRTAVGVRGMMRGRGRGAAGSRGAGAARGAFVPGLVRPGFRRYPPDVSLFC